MRKSSPRLFARNYRLVVICAVLMALAGFGISASSHSGDDQSRRDAAASSRNPGAFINSVMNFPMPLPSLTVTVTDSIPGDGPEVGKAGVGETIRYTVKIDNAGPDPATGLILQDSIDNNTTLVANSTKVSPLAANESYTSVGNMTLNTDSIGTPGTCANTSDKTSVLCNDTQNATNTTTTITKFASTQAGLPAGQTPNGTNTVTTANNGIVTLDADGTFNYKPAAGYEGTDEFWYRLSNEAGSDDGKVSITVGGANGMVWFVDRSASAGGTGTQAKPFQLLSEFQNVNNTGNRPGAANNDTIFLYENATSYAGPLTMRSGQKLIGQDTATSLATLGAPTAQPGNAYPATNSGNGTLVTIGSAAGGILLNSGNTLSGFTLGGGAANVALQGTNFGTLSLSQVSVNASGQALSLTTGALQAPGGGTATFGTVTSGAGTNGILLNAVTGSMSTTGGTLTGTATGPTFSVVGGSVSVTFSGGITQANNSSAVSVTGGHNGTLTFQTGTISATNGTGLQFSNADGTYNFNGTTTMNGGDAGVDILTDSAGTFNFASGTTITSPSGTAFNVDGGASTSTANVTYNGNITQANSAAMVSITNHNTGTITFQNGTLNATNGTGLQFSNADSTTSYNFNGTTTLNGGDAGIDILSGSDGTFTFGPGTAITRGNSVGGEAFNLSSSNSNVTYSGSMSLGTSTGNLIAINNHDSGTITFQTGNLTKGQSSTQGINIQNSNGGTININNPTVTISSTTANAISLTSNTSGIMNFAPAGGGQGIDLTTTSGIGFNATGGGTVTVTGSSNSITSTTGIGLNVTSTDIGSSGLNFVSINTNGASSGIVLTSTGTAAGNGGLTVTGTATGSDRCGGTITNTNTPGTAATVNAAISGECTGGTIQATSSAGVILNNTKNTSLSRMRILNAGTDGISINNINGFTLTNSLITDSSGVAQDRGIDLGDFNTGTAVNGTITVTNSTLGPTPHDNFGAGIGSGTSTWNITGTLFDDSQLNSGFNFELRNATVSNFNMSGCVLRNQFADGMQMQPSGSSTGTITTSTIQNNTFLNNNLGLDLNHDGTANITYRVLNNTFQGHVSHAINFFSSAVQAPTTGGTYNGRLEGNVIGVNGSAASGSVSGNGMRVNINGGTDATVVIHNNIIRETPRARGMEIISRNGTGGLDVTVTNNTVLHTNLTYCGPGESAPCAASFPLAAIFIQSNCVGACNSLRADVRGNTVPSGTASDILSTFLQVAETSGAPNPAGISSASLVDNSPNSATATAELTESHTNPAHNNTGSASAESDVGLISGPINTVAMNMLQMNDTRQQYYAQNNASDNSNNSLLSFLNSNRDFSSVSEVIKPGLAASGQSAGARVIEAGAAVSSNMTGAELSPASLSVNSEIEKGAAVSLAHGKRSASLTSRLSSFFSTVVGAVTPSAHAAPAPMAPPIPDVNLPDLPANKSITVTFDVTVNGPHPFANYTNNATVKATGVADINKQTVTPGDRYNTTTALTAAPTSPATAGETVTFTATVTPSEQVGVVNPALGGFVQFKDGASNLGAPVACTADGNNCKAELQTSSLTPGAHSITAQYLGGTHHEASTSAPPLSYTINPCINNPVVTTTADGTGPVPPGSLREALATVCPNAPNNKITFATGAGQAFDPATAPHVIQLTSALPSISKNIIVEGPGANVLEVRGSQVGLGFRVFSIGNTATNVAISGMTISGGSDALGGGGVGNAGTLTLSDCAIGTPTNTNITTGSGGGVHNTGTLTIDRCTISNNTATVSGGGIFNAPLATLTVKNSTISTNTSNGGNNTGGGVNNAGTATFTNVTVAANLLGGGIVNANATPTSFTIGNTIVADSAGGSDDLSGIFNSAGYNLFETVGTATFGASTTTGNQTGVDPKLGPLANNGGLLLTHALLSGSTAIDAGDNTLATNAGLTTTDERGTGFPRKADGADVDAVQTVDIGAFELHPSVEDIADKTTAENVALDVTFNIGDATGVGSPLITSVTATSGNTTLVPNANLVVSAVAGSDTQRKLTITPAANLNSTTDGTATITVTVTATNGQTATDTFVLTVTDVNSAPTATADALSSVNEDSGQRTITIASLLANDTTGGAGEGGQTLTITAVGSAVGGTVSKDATNVYFTPTQDFNGAASFQYTVQDDGTTNGAPDPQSAIGTVSFTVDAVNDPIVSSVPGQINLSEDTVNFAITSPIMKIVDVDATLAPGGIYEVLLSNDHGKLTLTTNPGLTFTVGDGTDDVTMTFHGTLADINTALATTKYTPDANFNGVAHITLQGFDIFGGIVATGSGPSTQDTSTFNAVVSSVNDVPTITAGGTLSYNEGDGAAAIDNTITVADVDNANISSATAQITGNYANGQDVLSFVNTATITGSFDTNTGKLTLTGSDTLANYQTALRNVTYENTSGNPSTLARTVSWIVNDGTDPSTAATSTINVTAVNTAPVNTVPGPQTVDEDTDLIFSTANGNAISVADVDVGTGDVTVTLTSGSGVLTLGSTAGLTSVTGDGTGSVTLTGTPANVNSAMNGLKHRNALDFNGNETVTVGVNDNGNTGTGGAKTDSDQIAITVTPVNDAPTLTNNGLTVNEGSTGNVIGSGALSLSDPDNPGAATLTFQLASVPANGTLKKSGTAMGVNDTFTQDDIDNNRITYDHDGSETTSDSFNFTASDGTNNIGSTAFNITVTPQSDAPSITTNNPLTVVPGTTGTIDSSLLAVTDPDNTAVELVYTLTSAPANGALKNGGTQLNSGDSFTQDDINNNLITYTHNGNAATTDAFNFTVSDGTTSVGGTFNININCTTSPIVTTTANDGPGSLRDAVLKACPANTITFNLDKNTDPGYDAPSDTFTITLTTGDLFINRDVTITGPTTQRVVISGNNTDPTPANRSRIFNIASGTVSISDLTLANGEAQLGGAIYNLGNLTLNRVTLTGNKAVTTLGSGGDGGAIDSDSGTLTIKNSTISGNTADGGGGGIHNCGDSTATLVNVTITGNRSDADDLSPGEGGGLEQVSSNTLTLSNTIVAGNLKGTAAPVANDIDVFGPGGIVLANSKNNLIGDAASSGGITDGSNGNKVGNAGVGTIDINTVLQTTLAQNGGPTKTHLLVAGSPAINAGDDTSADNASLTTDQRGTGFSRKVGTVDIGAYEVQAGITNSLAFDVQPSTTNAGVVIAPAVTVRILDVQGNLTTSTANVTLSIGNNPSGGTLSGTTTVAAVNGTATFSDLSIDKVGVGYTLKAASTGLADATSNAFNIISAAVVAGTKTMSGIKAPGQAIVYTVTLSNSGPGTQLDNGGNEFADALPTGITFVSANASSGTTNYVSAIRVVTWNGSIPAGGSVTITINATIDAGTTGQTISNQGTIFYDADGDGINNEANTLTDDPGVAGANNPTSFVVNAVPTIAAVGVTRNAGDAVSNSTIANVNDLEDAENTLAVTVNDSTSATVNGVTVSNLSVSAAGVVTANVVADCGRTTQTFTLKVTDSGGQSSTDTLTVTVNPNVSPVLSYSTQAVDIGASLNINPATGPTDTNLTGITVQDKGTYTGGISVNPSTGVVSITNAAPLGSHVITFTVADSCSTINVQLTLNVNKINQTITFNPLAGKTFGDADFTVSATASSNLPVSFSQSGNCTVTGNTVHITGAGSCTITASQAGDAIYNAAANVPQSFNISKANTTTAVTVANAVFDGQPHGGTAAVTGAGGLNQSLTVTYTGRNATTYGPSTTAPTNAGEYTASASFAGDANYNGSNDSKDFQIGKANQTITFNALTDKTFGDADFTVSATATSNLPVSFGATGNCNVTGNTVHITGAGTCTITASQAGDNNFNAAVNVPRTFNIAKQATTASVSSSLNPSSPGQNVTFTAVVNWTSGILTGTVQFKDGGANLGAPVPLSPAGAAVLSTNALSAGTHNITVEYSGDANFQASTGTLNGGQIVSITAGIGIGDVTVTEGNSGTTNAVFTVTLSQASNVNVSVDFATANGTATTADNDYQPQSGTLTFIPGETSKNITVAVNGDTKNEPNETFFVNLTNAQNGNIGDNQGQGNITNDDTPTVQLGNSTYTVNEGLNNTQQGYTSLAVDVVRSGDTSAPATVKYLTSDASGGNECNVVTGQASQRCDYILVGATLRFAAGETTKTIQIPIVNDGYQEGAEFFNIELSNPVGMTIGTTSQAIVTIQDDAADATPTTSVNNPYLSNAFFVRQNYLDLLGRDADQNGFVDWTNVLNNCGPQKGFLGAPFNCDRAHVAHGFFGSPEFTNSGFLIHRLFEVGMGRLPSYREFIPDMATLSGFNLTQAQQDQNLQDYLEQFTARSEFQNRYQGYLLPSQAAQFIDLMEQVAGVKLPATATTLPGQPTQYGRQELINLRASGTFSVGQTLKAFVEQKLVYDCYFERGEVTMMYFAFLRRDPNLNDPNLIGWNDWVDVFKNGRPAQGIAPRDIHHLLFGFIYSEEYRKRFGQP
ncbi:MAG TPA: cadherin-like domain-containing protein [Pyrinomonadaceae bacterium]|nr:cadherin-like domain-containing protein [Pyrinomonadaceae bacterium]